MGMLLTLIAGLVVWIVLWAIGVKSFDAFMITLADGRDRRGGSHARAAPPGQPPRRAVRNAAADDSPVRRRVRRIRQSPCCVHLLPAGTGVRRIAAQIKQPL